MGILHLKPTDKQTFILIGKGAEASLAQQFDAAHKAESEGRFEEACNIRYVAFQHIVEALPEEETIELDWEHANTRAAMEIIHASAIDNLLAGDAELAAAQLELLLECDSEDHTEATSQLAICYMALGENDCLEDIITDIDPKSALKPFAELWLDHRSNNAPSNEALNALRRHTAIVTELRRDEHPTDDNFIRDITSERPSKEALAREFYLKLEPVFAQNATLKEWLRTVI
ncbi:MAG: hypothetical protein IKA70_04400 [Alistipes sp.]|nr:hypothetical protein [Alistipes sp.]